MNSFPEFTQYMAGHVCISVRSKNTKLLNAAREWLSLFAEPGCNSTNSNIKVSLVYSKLRKFLPLYHSTTEYTILFEGDTARYAALGNKLLVELKKGGCIIIDRLKNKAVCMVNGLCVTDSVYDMEDYMHIVFELLRQNGLYSCHSGAVSMEGNGLLLIGKSGAGKSTLSLELLDNGFDFLSDDRCFLRDTDDFTEILAFNEPVRFFPENLKHINKLKSICATDFLYKKCFYPAIFYPDSVKRNCRLTGVILPEWDPHSKSSFQILQPAEVLKVLLPQTMVCFFPDTSAAHFDFNCKLVCSLPCARLRLGHDRHRWTELVRQFLQKAVEDRYGN